MQNENIEQSHYYSRKWFLETLFSPLSPHEWRPYDMTKCLYAVAEKFIRDKKMYQTHIDSSNIFITQYLLEILETSRDTVVHVRGQEHTIAIENVRCLPPHESLNKSASRVRLLPEQCNKRGPNYNFHVIVDIVYKIYNCPIIYPENLIDKAPEEKLKFEKEWLKMRDIQRKRMGRERYFAQYKPEDFKIIDTYRNVSLGTFSMVIGNWLCHLQSPLLQPGEGLWDPMGVFCCGGTYRLISPLKDLIINQDFVDFDGKGVPLEVWSLSEKRMHNSTQTMGLYYDMKHDKNKRCRREISISLPYWRHSLKIVIIFLALGFTPSDMITLVRIAARKQWKPSYAAILNVVIQNCPIRDSDEAFLCIAQADNKKDPEKLTKELVIQSAKLKIEQQLLPRLGESESANPEKAKWIGFLIWRCLMQGEGKKHTPNDPLAKDTFIVLHNHQFEIPAWARVEKQGDQRQKRKHRDHLANCRSDFHGVLMANLFRQIYGKQWRQVRSHFQATLNREKEVVLAKFFKNMKKLASRTQYCITTGRWASDKDKECRKNVSQAFSMTSAISQVSHLTYHSSAMNSDGKNPAPRQIYENQLFNLCPAETPETKKCGLTGHSSQVQDFCVGSPGIELEKSLKFYQEELFFVPAFRWLEIYIALPVENREASFDCYTQITLNGKPVGFTCYPEKFTQFFLQLRRTMTIDPFASIYYDTVLDNIQLRTDRGRTTVPFLIFSRLHHLLDRLPENYRDSRVPPNYISALSGSSFHAPAFVGPRALLGKSLEGKTYRPVPEDPELAREREVMRSVMPWTVLHMFSLTNLLAEGLVEHLDASERKMTVIAMQEEDYWLRFRRGQLVFTHMALDPHFMFSVSSGLTPLPDHNQSPRNTYMVAMMKAAIDLPLNKYVQIKTHHTLFYSQVPFVRTLSNCYQNEFLSSNRIEPIEAVIPYLGYSVEDAQNMGEAFTKRGAGLSLTSRLYRSEHKKKNLELRANPLANLIQTNALTQSWPTRKNSPNTEFRLQAPKLKTMMQLLAKVVIFDLW